MSCATWSSRSGRFRKARASARSALGHGRGAGPRRSRLLVRRLLGVHEERQEVRLDRVGLDAEGLPRAPRKLGPAPARSRGPACPRGSGRRAPPSPWRAGGRGARSRTRALVREAVARRASSCPSGAPSGFSLKGDEAGSGVADGPGRLAARRRRGPARKASPASPLRETSSSFASLIAGREGRDAHRDAGRGELLLERGRRLPARRRRCRGRGSRA